MITVITGTPGAGKTLYAISKLIRPLIGTTVNRKLPDGAVNEDGSDVECLPRTVYTNINGLLIDHELVQADTDQGLHNWHNWAKPGSVIVIDEFQRIWPPRPNGAKVPDDIAALDTHRHKGVDFILITQNLMNVDRHIHGLTGRHLHVRRMANLPLTIVYEWDHASRTLMFSKSISKSPWKYDKSVFKLYKSAEVHTKVPRKIPPLAFIILLAVCAAAYQIPNAWSRITGKADQVVVAKQPQKTTVVAAAPQKPASGPETALPASAAPASAPEQPEVAGCAAAKGVCRCYTATAKRVTMSTQYCEEQTQPGPVQLAQAELSSAGAVERHSVQDYSRRVDHDAAAQKDVLTWLAKRSGRVPY